MNIDIDKRDGAVVLSVAGEVDYNNSSRLRNRLIPAVEEAGGKVVVDLNGVERMDSSAIATFVEAGARAATCGSSLWLCGVNGEARRMLDLVSLDVAFRTCECLDEALNG